MKRAIKRASIFIICALLLASQAALPGLAAGMGYASPGDAFLTVRYTPLSSSNKITGIRFNAYRIAQPGVDAAGNPVYELADGYSASPTTAMTAALAKLNAQLEIAAADPGLVDGLYSSVDSKDPKYSVYDTDALKVNYSYDLVAELVAAFGGYINNNGSYNAQAAENTTSTPYSALTVNGEAAMSGLPDGLYLVASNCAYTLGGSPVTAGTRYIAAPFVIQIPYIQTDTAGNTYANRIVTAYAKWFTPADPPPATPPPTTAPPTTPPPTTVPPTTPPPTTAPPTTPPPTTVPPTTAPPTPTPTEELIEIPDESPPLGDIEILDEEIPLDDLPDLPLDLFDPTEDPGEDTALEPMPSYIPGLPTPTPAAPVTIADNPVPLDVLPQTGQLWWPVPLLAGAGALLIFAGALLRRSGRARK